MFEQDKIPIAIQVATRAHHGQFRKYTNHPYIVHPFAVAGLVSSVTDDEDMICAAFLHDVVEDTDVTLNTIRGLFGIRVGTLVHALTDVSNPSYGNREARKKLDREHIQFSTSEAKTIKLADLLDNTESIVAYDPNFAKVYMREKELLLNVLKEGDQMLWALARERIDEYKRQLDELEEVEEAREYLKKLKVTHDSSDPRLSEV